VIHHREAPTPDPVEAHERAVQAGDGLHPPGRPGPGHRRHRERVRGGGGRPGAAGCHRQRQDLHHVPCDPAPGPAHSGAVPQQDPGRPALRGTESLLPHQRGRILHQLLRLLPAGSLCAGQRHLHREGCVDQPGDRPPAPEGHQLAAGAAGRDHRGQCQFDLRPGAPRGLQGPDGRGGMRPALRPRGVPAQTGGHPLCARRQ
jgi:hypothetical protein